LQVAQCFNDGDAIAIESASELMDVVVSSCCERVGPVDPLLELVDDTRRVSHQQSCRYLREGLERLCVVHLEIHRCIGIDVDVRIFGIVAGSRYVLDFDVERWQVEVILEGEEVVGMIFYGWRNPDKHLVPLA